MLPGPELTGQPPLPLRYQALGESKPDRGLNEMNGQIAGVLYAAVMVAVIAGVDFLFLRRRFWERLIVNIGLVVMFAVFYLILLR
jgi:hypothetical protein